MQRMHRNNYQKKSLYCLPGTIVPRDRERVNTTLEKCLAGTPFNFVFEVKTTSMEKPVVFSGWPDHFLLKV